MKILHVTPTYYPNIGGIEAVIRNLCLMMAEDGHDCAVAHLGAGLSEAVETDAVGGFPIHRVPIRGNRLLGLAPGLEKVAEGYDILHVHDPQLMAITASVLRYAPAKPRVLSSHGFYGHTVNLWLFKALHKKALFRRLLSRYHAVLACSKADFAHAAPYAANVLLFENGIDATGFAVERAPAAGDLHKWLYWGRLSGNKRPDLLVDLVHALHQNGEAVQLVIAGPDFDGTLKRLTERRAALGMEAQIQIKEPLDQPALRQEIARAGLFVSASEYEGFGLTFLEAMAGGLGIVCRNKPPMAEFAAASGAGVAVDFEDIGGAVGAVSDLLRREPRELSDRARVYAAGHDWVQKRPELTEIYMRAIEA